MFKWMPVSLHFHLKHHDIDSYNLSFSEFVQKNCLGIFTCKSRFPDKHNLFACLPICTQNSVLLSIIKPILLENIWYNRKKWNFRQFYMFRHYVNLQTFLTPKSGLRTKVNYFHVWLSGRNFALNNWPSSTHKNLVFLIRNH